MCVPKRDSSDYRIIHDLSFPEYSSVNSGIPKDSYLSEDLKFRLPGLERLISFILSKGHGCKIFKQDLRRAFRRIAVDPRDIPLLGFQVDGQSDLYGAPYLPPNAYNILHLPLLMRVSMIANAR